MKTGERHITPATPTHYQLDTREHYHQGIYTPQGETTTKHRHQETPMDLKHCPQCDTTQPLTDFYKDRSRPDGRQGRCKACSKANTKAYREANPDKTAAAAADWRRRNPDKVREYRRRHAATHSAAAA